MESNQLNNTPNEDAVIEILTLTCVLDSPGDKFYYNKEGELHRIHGPAVILADGREWWYRNGAPHRTDGPAITWADGSEEYWIHGMNLAKHEFIQWQKEVGITPNEHTTLT